MLSTPVSPDGKPGDTRSKWRRGRRQRNELGRIWRVNSTEEEGESLLTSRKCPASAAGGGGHGRTARTCEDAGPSLRKGQTTGKHRLAAVAWEAQ